jgi:trans-aconitate methyltransferase
MNRAEHWDRAYQAKGPQGVSWFQPWPEMSLALIAESGVDPHTGVIDVGGGASTLVDALLDANFAPVAVLDVSPRALAEARARLGAARASMVQWIEQDVTTFTPSRRFALWHDRAVFHFLTAAQDRQRYVAALRRTLTPDGFVIIATFALDGPNRCSGLDVVRYDEAALQAEFGPEFTLRDVRREVHRTPWGSEQRFIYFLLRRQENDGQPGDAPGPRKSSGTTSSPG